MDSTHPECRDYRGPEDRTSWAKDLNMSGMFDSFDFVGLEVGAEEPGDGPDEVFVEFRARLKANGRSGPVAEGRETAIRERSRFLRDGDPERWLYAGGEVRSEEGGLEDVILN